MRRKRLRPFLEEVLSDADLRASAERVADAEPVHPAAADSFPPPPWEVASSNGHLAVDGPAVAEHPFAAPPPTAPPPAAPPVAEPDVADPSLAALADAFPLDPLPGAASVTTPLDPPPFTPDVAAAPSIPSAAVVEPPTLGAPPPPEPAVAAAAPAADPKPQVTLTGSPDPGAPGRRRRRSASLLPPLPAPADLPDDVAGRVVITSLPVPPGTVAAPAAAAPRGADPAPVTTVGGDAPLAGWLPVLALGAALVLVFIVGVLVTR